VVVEGGVVSADVCREGEEYWWGSREEYGRTAGGGGSPDTAGGRAL